MNANRSWPSCDLLWILTHSTRA